MSSEYPATPDLIRETSKEGEIVWRSPSGEEKIHLVRGDSGAMVSFFGNVIPDILAKMDSLNEANATRNHQLETTEEGRMDFQIEPNNNPNLQWRDLATQIDLWLHPPSWMKRK